MRSQRFELSALLLALLVAALPRTAAAALGNGSDVGGGKLKLGGELGLRYDNLQYAMGLPGGGDAVALIRVKGLYILAGEHEVADLSASADWNQFAGFTGTHSGQLSFLGAHVDGTAEIGKGRDWGVQFFERLARGDVPTDPLMVNVLAFENQTKIRGRMTNGPLELGLTGQFDVALYDTWIVSRFPGTLSALQGFNFFCVRGIGDAIWRVSPMLAFTGAAGVGTHQYPAVKRSDVYAIPINAEVGLVAALTPPFSIQARLGYGGILFAAPLVKPVSSLTGMVDLGYQFTPEFGMHLGGSRALSPEGGRILDSVDNQVFLSATGGSKTSFLGTLRLAEDLIGLGGAEGRTMQQFSLTLKGDWAVLNWLHVLGNVTLLAQSAYSAVVSAYGFNPLNRIIAGVTASALF